MEIKITPRDIGGTEFLAEPHRLHLGGQNAQGVDRLFFYLPDHWKKLTVTLHIRHCDGTLANPVTLDTDLSAAVDRNFTGWESGLWMLRATNGTTYTAYTRPAPYDVYSVLPTDGTGIDLAPSLYEQFVAQVLASAEQAQSAASQADVSRTAAENAADRAESTSNSLNALLSNAVKSLILKPSSPLCGSDALTATGAALTRSGAAVTASGSGSSFLAWHIPTSSLSRKLLRVTGVCSALTGGMKLVLCGTTKTDPDETEYHPLAVLSAGNAFDLSIDLNWYSANTDLDLTQPLEIRFVFTASDSSTTLNNPVLSETICSSHYIHESGSTLGEVLERIEAEITNHYPANS